MYINIKYEQEFDDLMMYLQSKYPKELFDIEGIGKQLDLNDFSKKFFASKTTTDASIDSNSNVDDRSVIAYHTELPKPFFKLNSFYMTWKELRRLYGTLVANRIVENQLTGQIYINDFHGIGGGLPYCFNYSSYDIMTHGLPMVQKIKSLPPKYLYSFKSQLEQFIVIASNSTLGATGISDILLVMSYYVKNILRDKADANFNFVSENDCWKYVEENIVSLIYTINQPMRANQSPFTNISYFDDVFLDNLKEDYTFPDGSKIDVELVKKLQTLFMNIMVKELKRTPLTFPIQTACFAVDDDGNILDDNFAELVAKNNIEYGQINIYCGSTSTLSSCCRLRSDKNNEYFNSFGSGSSKIGSIGVVTMNLPQLAFKNKNNEDKLLSELKDIVIDISRINNIKRRLIQKRIDADNHPLYKFGFMDISKQYSTVGINGLYECLDIMGYDILKEDGQEFAMKIINIINDENEKCAKRYNAPHNVEQTPSENSAIKLAQKDKLLGYNDKYDIYSNQFVPLIVNADLLDRVEIQGKFDREFTGGAIAHLNVETKIDDYKKIVELIKHCAKKGVIYWAINYNLQECKNGHMSVGKGDKCSICGEDIINNYTRVVGFLTNTKNWHEVRRTEDYPNRKFYKGI